MGYNMKYQLTGCVSKSHTPNALVQYMYSVHLWSLDGYGASYVVPENSIPHQKAQKFEEIPTFNADFRKNVLNWHYKLHFKLSNPQ